MTDLFPYLADDARVWIYQCNRDLSAIETRQIQEALDGFAREWSSHSRQVTAGGALVYNRFIILCADEREFAVSGCSIDSSVKFIKEIDAAYQLNLFDRLSFTYRDGDTIQSARRPAFEQLMEAGTITPETLVFNNLVATKAELLSKWEVPLKESWHKQMLVSR